MNTNATTPPGIRIANLPYSYALFAKAISRMSEEQTYRVSIEVWAEDPEGKLVELLRSQLPMEEFDKISPFAKHMIFKGEIEDLKSIGVMS